MLRLEDIDTGRCHPCYEQEMFVDLSWLGLCWEQPVWRQSERMAAYRQALDRLGALGVLYPCFCSRKEIAQEIQAAFGAPHLAPTGPDGPLYPGTCRRLSRQAQEEALAAGTPYALRLDVAAALTRTGPLTWTDRAFGEQQADPACLGDVILARKDTPTSYHLAVTLDDAAQGVTLVTRGLDLFHATHIHRLLQALLDLPVPEWHHHALLTDENGKRLAKRDNARALKKLREEDGLSPEDVLGLCQVHEAWRPEHP